MDEIESFLSALPDGVFQETLNSLPMQTGDVICTTSGMPDILIGEFWRFLARLVPGEVDHVIVYLGPDGLCAEAGMKGVILFTIPNGFWDAKLMLLQRGPYLDSLVGIACPLAGRDLNLTEESSIRQQVRRFCLEQALLKKPYNLNFLNPNTDESFYCSQLVYRAYLQHGINLNTGLGLPDLIGSDEIIFPQEIWASCSRKENPLPKELNQDSRRFNRLGLS